MVAYQRFRKSIVPRRKVLMQWNGVMKASLDTACRETISRYVGVSIISKDYVMSRRITSEHRRQLNSESH